MSVNQDLTDNRAEIAKVEGPEAAFLAMLQEEAGVSASDPTPTPKANPPETGETEEELEEELEPAEEESDDPEVEESDDLPEQDTEEEPVTEEAVYDVLINGETVQVTMNELQNGYSREADYTRRTQEVAEFERTLVADRDAVQAERAKYDGLLGQLQDVIEQSLPQEPDWTQIREQTPEQFPAIYAEWTQRKGQLEKVKAERERVSLREQETLAVAANAQAAEESKKLQDALPDLFDPEKAQSLSGAMLKAAVEGYGYTQADVNAIRDSRALRMLHDATQYRLLKQKGKKVTKRAKTTPTVKPGAQRTAPRRRSRVREAESRLKKSGSVEDAQAVFLQDMIVKKRA